MSVKTEVRANGSFVVNRGNAPKKILGTKKKVPDRFDAGKGVKPTDGGISTKPE